MMARMEIDYKTDGFLKTVPDELFHTWKFGLEIFEILQKHCCNTKFL